MSKNDWKLIIGAVGIKMSWVEKNRKINNQGGDDYSGLESTLLIFFLKKWKLQFFFCGSVLPSQLTFLAENLLANCHKPHDMILSAFVC